MRFLLESWNKIEQMLVFPSTSLCFRIRCCVPIMTHLGITKRFYICVMHLSINARTKKDNMPTCLYYKTKYCKAKTKLPSMKLFCPKIPQKGFTSVTLQATKKGRFGRPRAHYWAPPCLCSKVDQAHTVTGPWCSSHGLILPWVLVWLPATPEKCDGVSN